MTSSVVSFIESTPNVALFTQSTTSQSSVPGISNASIAPGTSSPAHSLTDVTTSPWSTPTLTPTSTKSTTKSFEGSKGGAWALVLVIALLVSALLI